MGDWDVQSWLEEIGYDKRYAQAFIDNGYDLPNLCANLKDEDLDAIEVEEEDRNRLFEHVERLRHYSFARVPISYDSPIPNGNIMRSPVNTVSNGLSSFVTKPSLDNFGASQEPSVKSPDSLGSVSHEMPENPPTSTTEVQLYSEALNHPSMHPPKKPPRSSKKQGKQIPPPLPSNSSGSLSKLQLKLKLKQELQQDHVLITEPPYVQESGEPNETLLQQLAVEYAEKFRIDSLEMYEALIELWRVQANQSAQVTPMSSTDSTKLSPGQDKVTVVQRQPAAYMDPYNGPPAKPPRRSAPPVPHNKQSSDKMKFDEKLEPDHAVSSSVNSSVTSTATSSIASTKRSFVSSLDSCPLASPPSSSNDIFLYEDVNELPDSLSGLNSSVSSVHSRESSAEKEHTSVQKTIVPSESLPSFTTNHLASDKTPGKKLGGLKKLLSRNSKKKLSSLPSTPTCDLLANAITMSDEERVRLMEMFKNHELSESEVLSKVTNYEEQQRSKRDTLFNELDENDAPSLPPRSSGVLLPLGKNGAPANKLGKVLPASKSNIKRSQSTEAVDSLSLSSSTSSSSDVDQTSTNHKPGVIASALKFFKKRKDNSKNSASNLTHSSSMPSIVIEGKLNEQNKGEKEPILPPAVPSAYSEVFDRVLPSDSGTSQSSSLPRPGSGNSSSASSSSSTLPSRGSPVSSPSLKAAHIPSRYRQKQQHNQQPNGCIKKSSPLTQTKTDLKRIPERQRQSSPEILMCTVSDAGVPIEWQNKDEEKENISQEQVKQRLEQINKDKQQHVEIVKESSEVSHANTVDTGSQSQSTTMTTKPVIPSRPKVPPKPSIPATSRTDKTAPKVTARAQSGDAQTALQNKPPVPKPRAKTPSSDEGRHSCSPVFDDELQVVPPAKPPRRRNTQMSSTSSRDTPSPVANRHTIFTTAPSAYAMESNREMFSPPISKPVLPPKPRRTSSSTSTIGLESPLVEVADRLNADEIDLGNIPYSTTWGECGIPVLLITRYAYELDTTFDEMARYLDQVRRHRLEQCQRVWVPMGKDYALKNQNVDTSSLKAWLLSIGLPMYHSELTRLGFRSVESAKRLSTKTYSQMQLRMPMHGQLLHKAVLALHRI